MNPTDILGRLGPHSIKGDEVVTVLCPFCQGGRKRDKRTFSMNTITGAYNCKRGTCSAQGGFRELLRHFGLEEKPTAKHYTEPKKNWTSLPPEETAIERYFKTRGITRSTLMARGVSVHGDEIVFPYRDADNAEKVVYVKYRTLDKKFRADPGGKLVLWGMEDCDLKRPLIITEGEIDALSLEECNITNVVSVPNGSSSTLTDDCWEWMEKFPKIIFWGDNDRPGKAMVERFIERLGEVVCYVVLSKYKDANEHFLKEGKESVVDAVGKALEVGVKGLMLLADYESPDADIETVKSGIALLDSEVGGGFRCGEMSVWGGESGAGKSVFLHQLVVESIANGHPAMIYSGELSTRVLRKWIELNMAGARYVKKDGDNYYLDRVTKHNIRKWYRPLLHAYDMTADSDGSVIISRMMKCARRYGVKTFLIDNLMTVGFSGAKDNLFRQQSEFMLAVHNFAVSHGVHVHVANHIRKPMGKHKPLSISKMDIAGSADITNRADNVFGVIRVPEDMTAKERTSYGNYQTVVRVFKCRFTGKSGVDLRLNYDHSCKRFWGQSDDPDKQFGWNIPPEDPGLQKLWEDA